MLKITRQFVYKKTSKQSRRNLPTEVWQVKAQPLRLLAACSGALLSVCMLGAIVGYVWDHPILKGLRAII